jgi:hypothetical protein
MVGLCGCFPAAQPGCLKPYEATASGDLAGRKRAVPGVTGYAFGAEDAVPGGMAAYGVPRLGGDDFRDYHGLNTQRVLHNADRLTTVYGLEHDVPGNHSGPGEATVGSEDPPELWCNTWL